MTSIEARAIGPHDESFTPERSPFVWLVEREILRDELTHVRLSSSTAPRYRHRTQHG